MGSGFSKMKKQAKLLEKQFAEAQEQMKSTQVEGEAGAGLVKLTLNGEKKLLSISISPDCIDKDDVEGLQDLIVAAYENAAEKLDDSQQNMGGLPAGLPFGL